MLDNQFYPTPSALVKVMWDKFTIKGGAMLEPSAGRGDLIEPNDDYRYNSHRHYSEIDVLEINFDNQAILRGHGCNVVGHDFLQFECKKYYRRIIMNPPFNQGAKHVLKAWDILVDGELVALVNAETLKNPSSKEKQLLANIIEDNNGDIEYLNDTFTSPDTQRKTTVEVAIIYLKKTNPFSFAFISDLKPDVSNGAFKPESESTGNQLALPQSTIKQAVIVFNAAIKCLNDEMLMVNQLKKNTNYYCGLLAESIVKTEKERRSYSHKYEHFSNDELLKEYNDRYNVIKERAWSHILTATNAASSLTKGVMDKLTNDFNSVSKLEFTVANIHGFLLGLVEQRNEMNVDVMCELFDMITGYHTDNRCYYRGWRSNDKHKNAYRIVMTRFILPMQSGWSDNKPGYEAMRKLHDFDLAFALLDGRGVNQARGITHLFSNDTTASQLAEGERVGGSYFEIRYYPKGGTMHFFPKSKKLIDRLNKIVGRARQWLPPEGEKVSDKFWLQYDKAESITKEMNKNGELERRSWDIRNDRHSIDELHQEAAQALGIDVTDCLNLVSDTPPCPHQIELLDSPRLDHSHA